MRQLDIILRTCSSSEMENNFNVHGSTWYKIID